MKIYTRSGDEGQTGLLGNVRVSKTHPCVEACGTLDELNSALGLAISTGVDPRIGSCLVQVQRDLFELGAEVAAALGPAGRRGALSPARISELEGEIDALASEVPPLTSFILPGGAVSGAQLHWSRTICRRAERRFVPLLELATERDFSVGVIFLNRLSDYLFVAARWTNHVAGHPEAIWDAAKTDR